MSTAPYTGQRFRLDNDCVFQQTDVSYVTPGQLPSLTNAPGGLPKQLIDLRGSKKIYLELSDTAAFIMRFVVQRVDTAMIREMLKSEYDDVDEATADYLLNKFFAHYLVQEKVLKKIPPDQIPAQKPQSQIENLGKKDYKPFDLNFKTNPIGLSVFKFPLL